MSVLLNCPFKKCFSIVKVFIHIDAKAIHDCKPHPNDAAIYGDKICSQGPSIVL
jgi:hypothetical protein